MSFRSKTYLIRPSLMDLFGGMAPLEALAWLVLVLLLARIIWQLQGIHALLVQKSARPPSFFALPAVLFFKLLLTLYGFIFLVFSKDKLSSKALSTAADPQELLHVDKQVRVIFVRHGESVWNKVFNRGFRPSFLWRLLSTVVHELFLVPFVDSAFIDSPLSELGYQQCEGLRSFLSHSQTIVDPLESADFAALTGDAPALLVSSQLRRAVSTVACALSQRLERHPGERIVLHSSCQEISRNFDTLCLCRPHEPPTLSDEHGVEQQRLHFDTSMNYGNKTLDFTGLKRLQHFAEWVTALEGHETVIVGGHSLWFRCFFQLYLPKALTHESKKNKIVNCGAIGFTLLRGTAADGSRRFRIDPDSIRMVYGGFVQKKKSRSS